MNAPLHPGRLTRRLAVAALVAAVALVMPRMAVAQAPQGHIAHIYPAGGQAGKTVRVTVGGSDLAGAKGVRVSGSGVTGKILKVVKGKTATVALAIAADAHTGRRDLRLVTPGGVTNRARFVIGRIAEVVEKEPNSAPKTAQPLLSLPVVVNGQILQGDRDLFRFSATAGETMVCRVKAQQLLPFIADAVPGWFQALLTLRDAAGNELARVDDDRFHPDPVLIYTVERDGEYSVEIRDSIFRGRADFVYRLEMGALPHITQIRPLGARQQATARIRLFGVHLPSEHVTWKLTSAGPTPQLVWVRSGQIDSNALPFAVGRLAETEEAEPNNFPKRANAIEVPVTISGQIQKPGDVDCYVFQADAEQELAIDVQARRLGSPLDSILTLVDSRGRPLAKNDDYEDASTPLVTHHADSHLRHTFAKAGKYGVKIADIQGKGGQQYAYRLTVSPPRPDFRLRVTPDNPRVGQGATTILTVHALRRDGFNGQIDLAVEDLPQGFTASGTAIPRGFDETILSLSAPGDAPLGLHTPTIVGSTTIAGAPVTRRVQPAEDVMQAFIYHHLLPTDELLLTVVKPGPFKLVPQMPPEGYVRFGAGRTAFVVVKVERTPQAKGPIRFRLHNPPKGVRMKAAVIPADKDEVKCEIRYPNRLPPTVRYNLILSGSTRVRKQTLTTLSPVILALGPRAKAPSAPKPKTTEP